MASTLLLIKSFSMLPHPEAADADEAEELKRDLVERLLEYQRYREAAAKLGERPLLGRDVFAGTGEAVSESDRVEAPLRVSVFDLVQAMGAVLRKIVDRLPRDLELRDIPIAQCIPRVLEAIGRGGRIEFVSLFDGLADRPLVIATFIALLELVRQRRVRAYQEVRFGPIWLERGEIDSEPVPIEQPADE
jgi:segregation and condensation protein A